MDHIFKNHMLPAARGKSIFTTTSRDQVRNLFLNTIAYLDVVEPHRWCADKIICKKRFPSNISRDGRTGCLTNRIFVVVRKSNNYMITAYPIL